jgi:hypothetical protein
MVSRLGFDGLILRGVRGLALLRDKG